MMRRRLGTPRVLLTLSALTLLGIPIGLAAQDDGHVRVFSFSGGRPRIGVTLDSRADKERDRLGASIQSVAPDGPADKAGLKAGDIITKFNGVALGGLEADEEGDSGPAQKLIELAHKLEPGDTAEVEYRRGNDSRKARIVARDLGRMRVGGEGFQMELPRMGLEGEMPRFPRWSEDGPGGFRMFIDGEAGGLNLADMNPELGEYFGTKEGVLVLESPKDSSLALKAGDVIVAIDGRAPTSEAHARRILRSYDAGETAKIDIVRKQKKLTISWKVPERGWKWTPRSREKMKVERS